MKRLTSWRSLRSLTWYYYYNTQVRMPNENYWAYAMTYTRVPNGKARSPSPPRVKSAALNWLWNILCLKYERGRQNIGIDPILDTVLGPETEGYTETINLLNNDYVTQRKILSTPQLVRFILAIGDRNDFTKIQK